MLASEAVVNYGRATTARPSGFGQGKRTATILADQGDCVHVITDLPYRARTAASPVRMVPLPRGSRPMHKTTLTIATSPATDYTTTVKHNFGGSKSLSPAVRPLQYPSQHTSQVYFGRNFSGFDRTSYSSNFYGKETDVHYKLHYPTFANKMNMNHGLGIKQVMTSPNALAEYWTQYSRIHNKLGVMLGPGVPRKYPVRQQTNVITGEIVGPAWKEDNKRMSGNRVLYQGYRNHTSPEFVLG